jgi:hydrogenase maturation protease
VRYLIGVGTYAASDDGVGLRVVEAVAEQGLEDGFQAIDLSGNTLNLVSYLTPETEAILILDCARMDLAPGEFRFFGLDDVETRKSLTGFSTHEGDLTKVVELARAMRYPIPPLQIMGIEPSTVEPGFALSSSLDARLTEYVAASITHLRGM